MAQSHHMTGNDRKSKSRPPDHKSDAILYHHTAYSIRLLNTTVDASTDTLYLYTVIVPNLSNTNNELIILTIHSLNIYGYGTAN